MTLGFYFDFVSPYAYVAWTQVHALAVRHGRAVAAVPVLFAGILDALGQKGPAEIPAKRAYTYKDAYRKAHRAGLTLRMPPGHPFNPLLALRIATLLDDDAVVQRRAIDALYAAAWRDGAGIDTPDRVQAALDGSGLDGAALIARAPEAKDRLRERTAAAVARGVFGVPTLDAGGELFWGIDGLDFADGFLRGDDPVPPGLADVPISASRR